MKRVSGLLLAFLLVFSVMITGPSHADCYGANGAATGLLGC